MERAHLGGVWICSLSLAARNPWRTYGASSYGVWREQTLCVRTTDGKEYEVRIPPAVLHTPTSTKEIIQIDRGGPGQSIRSQWPASQHFRTPPSPVQNSPSMKGSYQHVFPSSAQSYFHPPGFRQMGFKQCLLASSHSHSSPKTC